MHLKLIARDTHEMKKSVDVHQRFAPVFVVCWFISFGASFYNSPRNFKLRAWTDRKEFAQRTIDLMFSVPAYAIFFRGRDGNCLVVFCSTEKCCRKDKSTLIACQPKLPNPWNGSKLIGNLLSAWHGTQRKGSSDMQIPLIQQVTS